MELKDKIHRLRLATGLSLEKFGGAIGVSRQTVYQWEKGETTPTNANLKALSNAFGTPYNDFFDAADPAPPDPFIVKAAQLKPEERAIVEATMNAVIAQRPRPKRRVK